MLYFLEKARLKAEEGCNHLSFLPVTYLKKPFVGLSLQASYSFISIP